MYVKNVAHSLVYKCLIKYLLLAPHHIHTHKIITTKCNQEVDLNPDNLVLSRISKYAST